MEKQTFLTFQLGQEYFAVNVCKVLEVLEKQHITKVPQVPQHILGIINFRGNILPVVDMRLKFNLSAHNGEEKNFVIVYDISNQDNQFIIAATSDSVKDVIEISEMEIKPVPEMGIKYNSKYIIGAVRRDDTFILLLDIEKVLSIAEAEKSLSQETNEMQKAIVE